MGPLFVLESTNTVAMTTTFAMSQKITHYYEEINGSLENHVGSLSLQLYIISSLFPRRLLD